MSQVVRPAHAIRHRSVFELRYDFGQLYWDRAGRIAREIIRKFEGWDLEQVDPSHCVLRHDELNLTFSFGPHKLDMSQSQSDDLPEIMPANEFGKKSDELAEIVLKLLELEVFSRIGFREWLLFKAESRNESYELVRRLKLFRLDLDLIRSLGTPSEMAWRVVVERGQQMVRVAVAPFEQAIQLPENVIRAAKLSKHDRQHDSRLLIDSLKAKKVVDTYPQFGLLADFDAYIEDPPFPDNLSVSDFVHSSATDIGKILDIVVEESDEGKHRERTREH